jgi:hypothetical protein
MEPVPRAPFKVIEPDFALQFLIVAFDPPAQLPESHRDAEWGRGRSRRQVARVCPSFLPRLPRFGNVNNVGGASYRARTKRSA